MFACKNPAPPMDDVSSAVQSRRASQCCQDFARQHLPVAILIAFIVTFLADSAVAVDNLELGAPTVGWGGRYVVGKWAPVTVPVTVKEAGSVQLELSAVDSDGNRVIYASPEVKLDAGERQLTGVIKVGRLNGEIGVRLVGGPQKLGRPGRTSWLEEPLKPSTNLVVTVGKPSGFDAEDVAKRSRSVRVVESNWKDLPADPLAYDCVSSLVFAGQSDISPEQAEALKGWVARGGRLIISLPHDLAAAKKTLQPLVNWLPVKVGDQPAVVREFGGLMSYAGKNTKIPYSATLSIPSLRIEAGEVLASSRTDAFLVRAPYALGTVSVLALDLTALPLRDWTVLPQFSEKLTSRSAVGDIREKHVSKGAQLSSTGISDLATQLNATQEDFEKVQRISPWYALGLLLVLLLAVGPLDYLIVHKILRRPQLTWITFPVIAMTAAWSVSVWATTLNGSTRRANQLDILDVDVATSMAFGRHFVTLYSPTTAKSSVAVESQPISESDKTSSNSRLSWYGVPETNFGGMLRETGIEQGATYREEPDGSLADLPVIQWSSKALVAESQHVAEGVIDCNLRASGTGRLTGTISHRFSATIEDWMVVYKNVVYRHLKKKDDADTLPFPSKQVWRVDQPSVYSRELRPYLTGMITMATPRAGSATVTDVYHQQSTYDPLSLDPGRIFRTLTFHEEVGGDQYTGLSNQMLDVEDFSRLMRLGRAVLLGRLSKPVSTIRQDGQTIEPDRLTTFVRVILPVERPSEMIKDLRRVVPE